ncbi:hypothetical protein [Paenibacillus gorillae]|uniref:hypothetical protein n=1 Tax=Paenibacillus gorillae TaxID=1243662 RepID=UPI0004B0538B|nr:hypothetical protein [Paenibacillus gorillae]
MTLRRTGTRKPVCKGSVVKRTICKTTIRKTTVSKQTECKPVSRKKCTRARFKKSAFAAISGIDQTLTNGVFSKVQYQVEELDLNNEYNSATSTFRPKQNGVYTLVASVAFEQITMTPVRMDLEIRVNGVPRITDQENFTPRTGIIDASGIVQLKVRDRVEVFARATGENGDIQSGVATRFEGARIN